MLEFEVDDLDAEFRRLRQLTEVEIEFIIPPTTRMAQRCAPAAAQRNDGTLRPTSAHGPEGCSGWSGIARVMRRFGCRR